MCTLFCGGSDFEVEVTIVPRGVELSCKACGYTTPIVYYDGENKIYGINGDSMLKVYRDSHLGDMSSDVVSEAYLKDCKAYSKK